MRSASGYALQEDFWHLFKRLTNESAKFPTDVNKVLARFDKGTVTVECDAIGMQRESLTHTAGRGGGKWRSVGVEGHFSGSLGAALSETCHVSILK
jgi:hypothetical protein